MSTSRKGIRPIRVLPAGFLAVILLGAALLCLPGATVGPGRMRFFDALFTAVSATCVTGLVVVDTGTYFTGFGQAIVLAMIQLGGLGFMTVAAALFSLTRRRVSLRERMVLAESFGEERLQGVLRLSRAAAAVTLMIEGIGAALLAVRFVPQFGWGQGIWCAVFHSVSAFCNAGFDLMGSYRSLTGYTGDWLVNLVIIALIALGGVGFSVLLRLGKRRLNLHARLVLMATPVLLLGGGTLITLLEYDNPATMGTLSAGEKWLAGLFQSATLRTAGFNTIDQFGQRETTKLLGVLLMLVGGAPAGTAGGLKITTLMVLFLTVRQFLRGRSETTAFGRTLPQETVRRSLCIVVLGLALLLGVTVAISLIEEGKPGGDLPFLDQLFEATSAMCTVGLSTGLTAVGTDATRALLCLLMFAGRVGLLTLALSLVDGRAQPLIRYPQEDVLVG